MVGNTARVISGRRIIKELPVEKVVDADKRVKYCLLFYSSAILLIW